MILLETHQLKLRLEELLQDADAVDIALAWIREGVTCQNFIDFAKTAGKKVRVIAGVRDYITSPNALRLFRASGSLRIGFASGSYTFHPKLYIFHIGKKRIVWSGSANLTESAFTGNVELVAEFEDPGDWIAWFRRTWIGSPEG